MGFRPICPVIRGSAPPIIDAHVDLPSLQADKEGMPDNDAPLKPSAVIDAIAPDSDVDTSSSPDDETSDQSGQSECDDRLETFHAAGLLHWLCNPSSLVVHVATPCSSTDQLCAFIGDTLETFKAACGSPPVAERTL